MKAAHKNKVLSAALLFALAIHTPPARAAQTVDIDTAFTLPSLFFDFGVQGYVGKREGVTGSAQIRWEF